MYHLNWEIRIHRHIYLNKNLLVVSIVPLFLRFVGYFLELKIDSVFSANIRITWTLNIESLTSTDTQKLAALNFTLKSTTKKDYKKILYDKRDDFTFPIVNFPFTSNISASAAYEVYISLLIRYSRVGAKYSDFLNRAQ